MKGLIRGHSSLKRAAGMQKMKVNNSDSFLVSSEHLYSKDRQKDSLHLSRTIRQEEKFHPHTLISTKGRDKEMKNRRKIQREEIYIIAISIALYRQQQNYVSKFSSPFFSDMLKQH